MATTSPDNLWSPDPGNNYNLTVDLAAMQASVQTALTALRTDLNNATSDTGWVAVSLIPSVTGSAYYRKKAGIVYLSISVSASTITPANSSVSLFASPLPANIRPDRSIALATVSSISSGIQPNPTSSGLVNSAGNALFLVSDTTYSRTMTLSASWPERP